MTFEFGFRAAHPLRGALLVACAFIAQASQTQAALTISKKPTQNVTCSKGMCSTTALKATLNVKDLQQLLGTFDVTVASGSAAQDIVVVTSVSWTGSHLLTLDSYRSIIIHAPVNVMGTTAFSMLMNDGGVLGDLSFSEKGRVKFWDLNSALVINGVTYKLENTLTGISADIEANPAAHYALADNYDASGDGTYGDPPVRTPLTGTFEGLGNTISHLSIDGNDAGFFDRVETSAVVRDLGIDGTIQSFYDEGLVAAINKGTITRCFSSGTVTSGTDAVGGLVGWNFGGTISWSHSNANMSGATNAPVGGLVGSNSADGNITNSFGTGSVTENNGDLGGLVGYNTAGISFSYATGPVSGPSLWTGGGLVGRNDKGSSIEKAYATGSVSGGSSYGIGGFAGVSQAKIWQSYSTGAVNAQGSRVGGFVGSDLKSGAITDSFWDLDTSGVSDPAKGAGNISNDAGLIGLTTQEFQSTLPAGFDRNTWTQKSGVNSGFPYLKAVPPR